MVAGPFGRRPDRGRDRGTAAGRVRVGHRRVDVHLEPEFVALPAALAIAFAWHAWSSGRGRWWLGAAAAGAVVAQCHVLGAALLVGLAGWFAADMLRGGSARGARRRRLALIGLGCVVVVALSYAPLLAYDLGHDFSEARAAVTFLTGGGTATDGGSSGLNLPVHVLLVLVRALSWPLTGLVTSGPTAPLPALLAALLVGSLALWGALGGGSRVRVFMRGFLFVLTVSVAVLVVGAPGLTTVVAALPVDQYHAFLDPLIVVVAGVGLARLWPGRPDAMSAAPFERRPDRRLLGVAVVAALVALNAAAWPPLESPDGGWPAARLAASRVESRLSGDGPLALLSLPEAKPPDALGFPLTRDGVRVVPVAGSAAGSLVIACDRVFRDAIGADCGGPAEDAAVAALAPGSGPAQPGAGWRLVDRFDLSDRTVVSVYAGS